MILKTRRLAAGIYENKELASRILKRSGLAGDRSFLNGDKEPEPIRCVEFESACFNFRSGGRFDLRTTLKRIES
jgi:hypothetical protein